VVVAIYLVNGALFAWGKWRGGITLDRYWLGLMFLAAPFAWALGAYFLLDFVHGLPSSGAELVRGRVIMRQRARDDWGLEHPELTIKVDGRDDVVRANLSADSAERIPDEVSFYYSGDPRKEVRLREETNPLGAALFLLLTPLLMAAGLVYAERRRHQAAAATHPLGPARP
jgi:hypothetical protein